MPAYYPLLIPSRSAVSAAAQEEAGGILNFMASVMQGTQGQTLISRDTEVRFSS